MKTQPGYDGAERIAFATSEPAAVVGPTRWTELAVYYLRKCPAQPGRRWMAVSRGCSTHPGETEKEEVITVGTLARALKLFSDSQLGRSVCAQAEDWAERNASLVLRDSQRIRIPLLKPGKGLSERFTGTTDREAIDWLYKGETDGGRSTLESMLNADFGLGERTAQVAFRRGSEIRIPLVKALRYFDREAFLRDRKVEVSDAAE